MRLRASTLAVALPTLLLAASAHATTAHAHEPDNHGQPTPPPGTEAPPGTELPPGTATPPGTAPPPETGTPPGTATPPGTESPPSDTDMTVVVNDVDGAEVGQVTLAETDAGLRVSAQFQSLEPGFKGFHLHERPNCEVGDRNAPFQDAGGHYSPDGEDHPNHAGDLPPLLVNTDGTAELTVVTDRVTWEELTGSGAAIMVHDARDNFAHIPDRYAEEPDQETLESGDAGTRMACGVIDGQSGDGGE